MNNNLPLCTILIATFNYGHFIREAIQSALDQDYQNKNIFIVDDCSTDNTYEVFDSFPNQEIFISKPIQIFREDEIDKYEVRMIENVIVTYIRLKANGGPSRARNIGITNAMAGGASFIQILDADDMLRLN